MISPDLSTPLVPRAPLRLRHDPLEPDLPARLSHAWSAALVDAGPEATLASVDGRALLVDRAGVAVLGASADAATWARLVLPPGRPGTAVAGPIPWLADDGRLFRWTPDGAVDELPGRVRAEAALALDERRVLIMPAGAAGELALLGDGAEVWRGHGTLADSCPGRDVAIVGVPGDAERVAAVDLATGRIRWKARPDPYRLAAVVAVWRDLLWVACADRTIAALRLTDGRLAHAHDTGVRPPTGAVDAGGRLHVCHERKWVAVALTPTGDVAEPLRLTDGGPFVDPPVPVRGGRLLVRSAAGEVLLLDADGATRLWRGRGPVWAVAAAEGRLYLLEDGDPPTLHCLADSMSAR